jgi:hypothetical protein
VGINIDIVYCFGYISLITALVVRPVDLLLPLVRFPEGEFKIARFLGPHGRFRVGRPRSPPDSTPSVLSSALSPVTRTFPPTRGRRFDGTEYRPFLHERGFSRLGPTVRVTPRVTPCAWLSYPAGCGREASGEVTGPVAQPGNAVTTEYGSVGINNSGDDSRLTTERWVGSHRVGFIPRVSFRLATAVAVRR